MNNGYEVPTRRCLERVHPERPLQWTDYADAWLHFPLGRLLDYGCGTGTLLRRVVDRASECWGVDIDPDKIDAARQLDKVQADVIDPRKPLPFADGYFDTVAIVEVIEHVSDERAILAELTRVLKPGGRLLLTTPYGGLLTFMDPGNVKFVAPRIHRFVHCTVLRQHRYYEQRFGDSRGRDRGMIADFMLDQTPWHRHYRYERIRALAPPDLETLAWAVYFPAFRALWCFRLALKVATLGRVTELPWPLSRWNAQLSRRETTLGDQLVVLFEKKRNHGRR